MPIKKSKWVIISLALATLFNLSSTGQAIPPYSKIELLAHLIRLNDNNIPVGLSKQLVEKDKEYYGAVYDADSVVSPIGTAHLIQTLMCSYVSRDS